MVAYGAVNSNLEAFAEEGREVKVTMFGCLVDRLYREDEAYYEDGDESVCYGAARVLGEIWPLRERRETLGGNRFVATAREGAVFLRSSSVEDGAVDRGRFSGGEEIGRGGNGSAA